jgi:hypothetical protein
LDRRNFLRTAFAAPFAGFLKPKAKPKFELKNWKITVGPFQDYISSKCFGDSEDFYYRGLSDGEEITLHQDFGRTKL